MRNQKIKKKKPCKWCKSSFLPTTPGQLYCSSQCKEDSVHQQKIVEGGKWRSRRIEEGYCSTCGCRKPLPGRKMCSVCRDRARKVHARLKDTILGHYGRECACCGEKDPRFLTIDHINGRGEEEKKNRSSGYHLYSRLKKEGFPEGFQVLCFNCNHGRWVNGGVCPHKDPR